MRGQVKGRIFCSKVVREFKRGLVKCVLESLSGDVSEDLGEVLRKRFEGSWRRAGGLSSWGWLGILGPTA